MIETEGQKEKLEEEIEEVEKKIKEKEEELERLQAEVKVLVSEILEGVVVMEKGGLKKRERVKTEKKCKEDEMRKLDLEIVVDKKKNKVAQLAGKKLELEENKGLVEKYLERYYEELKEKDKRK